MLSIYVYGPVKSGYLDIDPATVLDIEEYAEPFDVDLSVGIFSLPIDIPWTDNNRVLLGYAERLENFSTNNSRIFKCDVYDDGLPQMQSAKFSIIEKVGMFSYSRGKFSATITGSKGLLGTNISNKLLTDLKLGGPITWTGADSRSFAMQVMKGVYPQYGYISFAPVAIENYFDNQRPDFTTEFLAKNTVNNVLLTGAGGPDAWEFARPTSADPTLPANAGNAEYIDFRTVPFFTLKFVLQKIFEENGFIVSGALIDGTDFDHLHVFNNYGIEKYNVGTYTDSTRKIDPSNHVPPVLIKDFLQAIFDFFCIYPSFGNPGEVKLLFRDAIFSKRKIFDISGIVSDEFDSTIPQETSTGVITAINSKYTIAPTGGYKVNYTWDGNDQYYGDRVKDMTNIIPVATVATRAALDTLAIGRPFTTNDFAFVEADNMYYQVANAVHVPVLWDAYSEGLNSFVKGAGEKGIDINCSTLCTYVEYDAGDALFERRDKVGTRQLGSYITHKGALAINPFGIRIFYIDKKDLDGSGVLQPYSYNNNRDATNTIIERYSLALNGPDGVVKKLHAKWEDANLNQEIMKTNLLVDNTVVDQLEACNTVSVNNILMLPYKVEKTLPLQKNNFIFYASVI